jgi:peptidoglycan/LPS O-acetylase OafA/YrhL
VTLEREEHMIERADLDASRGTSVALDLVRFAAALLVVLYHFAFFSWHEPASELGGRAAIGTAPHFTTLISATWFGWVGVEIFFVLSGLLIAASAAERSPREFVVSRALRIVPALWFFATLSALITTLYSSADLTYIALLHLKSLALFPKGPWIDGVYWTLTVEVMFYAMIWFLLITRRFDLIELLTVSAAAILFLFYGLVTLAVLAPQLPVGPLVLQVAHAYPARLVLLTTGSYFIVGLGLYLLAKHGHSFARTGALVAGLLAGAAGIWFNARTSPAVVLYGEWVGTPVAVWLLCVSILTWSVLRPRRSVAPRILAKARLLGLATYPLYLLHNIVGAYVFGILLRCELNAYLALVLAIVLCVGFGIAFSRWLEPPLRSVLRGILGSWRRRMARLAASRVSLGDRGRVNLARASVARVQGMVKGHRTLGAGSVALQCAGRSNTFRIWLDRLWPTTPTTKAGR